MIVMDGKALAAKCKAAAAEEAKKLKHQPGLAVVLVGNVFFANQCWLKMHLQYENAASFYTILLSRVQDLPGYTSETELALIGRQDNKLYTFPQFDLGYLNGPPAELINIYSRENFIRRYIGSDIPFASSEELDMLSAHPDFAEMAEYPYYGSVRLIDGYAVVKLG